MPRPLTILAVNWHSGGSAALYSGGGRRAREILGGLARRGHRVHVVDVAPSVVDGVAQIASIRTVAPWLRSNLAAASFPEKAAAAADAAIRLSSLARREARRVHPDIVYVPTAELLAGLVAGLRASRVGGVPIAGCATTIVRWAPHGRDTLLHLTRRLLRRMTATIVLVPSVAEKLRRDGFSGRILVGLTGVDRSPLRASQPALRLLFLSRVVPEKGVADAVAAFAAVAGRDGASLEIRGSGSTREWQRIQAMGNELGLGDALRLGGPIATDEEKWRILAGSWGFVAPSYIEHFGLAVREALSAGLPTVAYQLPPFDDLQGHPRLIAVKLGDIEALSGALARVLRLSASERSELAEAGRSFSVGPTWAEAVDREEQILTEMVSGSTS
jgi:glycosyltransferase involved in cell wall biosynthesis